MIPNIKTVTSNSILDGIPDRPGLVRYPGDWYWLSSPEQIVPWIISEMAGLWSVKGMETGFPEEPGYTCILRETVSDAISPHLHPDTSVITTGKPIPPLYGVAWRRSALWVAVTVDGRKVPGSVGVSLFFEPGPGSHLIIPSHGDS